MKCYEKLCTKTKTVIGGVKRSKTTNKAKPFENTNKNPQSFLEISPMQKEAPPSTARPCV